MNRTDVQATSPLRAGPYSLRRRTNKDTSRECDGDLVQADRIHRASPTSRWRQAPITSRRGHRFVGPITLGSIAEPGTYSPAAREQTCTFYVTGIPPLPTEHVFRYGGKVAFNTFTRHARRHCDDRERGVRSYRMRFRCSGTVGKGRDAKDMHCWPGLRWTGWRSLRVPRSVSMAGPAGLRPMLGGGMRLVKSRRVAAAMSFAHDSTLFMKASRDSDKEIASASNGCRRHSAVYLNRLPKAPHYLSVIADAMKI